ncbi:hypothetical protein [Paenarthrobacter sp. 22069]|uniref:hypothetical protein n=1 Tax=Paenarthrobacter sp. 22069 TaxID=3453864 RepID=UPI003F87E1E0
MALMFFGGLSMFGLAVAAFIKWPMLVLYSVGAFALMAWEFPALPTLFSVAGTQIKPEDAVVLTALTATALRPERLKAVTRRRSMLMLLIAGCLAVALLRGSIIFQSSAFNEFRGFLWPIGLTAWMLNHDWQSPAMQAAFQRWITVTGLGLSVLFAYHVAAYGLGNADSFVTTADGVDQTGRPLVSSQALLLALSGMNQFKVATAKGKSSRLLLGAGFLSLAILCQHRSVWVAVGIGLLLVVLRLRGVPLARTVVGGFFASVLALVIYASGIADPLIASLTKSLESSGTYSARLDTWSVLIDDSFQRGVSSVIFGEPFGFGYNRYDGLRLLTFAPHNWYVSVFLRLGLVGLGLFAIVLLSTLNRLITNKAGVLPTAVFLSIVIYSWSYSLSWYLAPMLGWCIAQAWGTELKTMPQKLIVPRARRQPRVPNAYMRMAAREGLRNDGSADAAPELSGRHVGDLDDMKRNRTCPSGVGPLSPGGPAAPA